MTKFPKPAVNDESLSPLPFELEKDISLKRLVEGPAAGAADGEEPKFAPRLYEMLLRLAVLDFAGVLANEDVLAERLAEVENEALLLSLRERIVPLPD